ncbi:MAG: hypothetical protein R3F56_10480 [Planctomycetota bacterium]
MRSSWNVRVALSGSGDVAYSNAIPLAGANACGCFVVMEQLTGSTPDVNVTLQVSMDQVNWTEPLLGPAASQDVAEVGALPLDPMTPILAPYIRLRFTLTGDVGILNVNLHTYST